MQPEQIKAMQLNNQYLVQPDDMLTVAKNLCGIQAQFFSNAVHALKIRCRDIAQEDIAKNLVKGWTLRGTMHLYAKEDMPLFICRNNYLCNDWNRPSFWNQRSGWALTPKRQADFSCIITDALKGGPLEREELKEICMQQGMSEAEAASMFDPWGGGIREMCERGFIHYLATEKKQFCISNEFEPLEEKDAELALAKRYFTYYGPATVHDAMYFFHASAKKVKEWISILSCQATVCQGKEYYYLNRNGARCNAEIPSCIFLAGFDPLMLGYEKKESLYLKPQDIRKIFNLAGIVMPALLINGEVAGRWKMKNHALSIEAFRSLEASEKSLLEEKAKDIWNNIKSIQYL